MRAWIRALSVAAALVASPTACLLSIAPLPGADGNDAGEAGLSDSARASDSARSVSDGGADTVTDAPSCRALRSRGVVESGVYTLRGADGGAFQAYCDMTTFDGGWTLVTPSMIVEEKTVQDYDPASSARVAVDASVDPRGGIRRTVRVVVDNCGKVEGERGPGHYFLVGELDGWTQIMATYTFRVATPCWDIFGDVRSPETNVHPIDLAQDTVDLQQNMGRTADGGLVPYGGQTHACDDTPDNFWGTPYANLPKGARVVMRRNVPGQPAGLSLQTDCEEDTLWDYADVFVR